MKSPFKHAVYKPEMVPVSYRDQDRSDVGGMGEGGRGVVKSHYSTKNQISFVEKYEWKLSFKKKKKK